MQHRIAQGKHDDEPTHKQNKTSARLDKKKNTRPTKKEREEMIKKIKQNPREFVAQPLEILSTIPTISEDGIEPRHLDLRPFILNGKSTYVTMGGLTRVALRKGSTIVNSSQGGGSKDTMVVET